MTPARPSRHRVRARPRRAVPSLPFVLSAAVLFAVTACAAERPEVAVPRPPAEESALCSALDEALPETVGGHDRSDPEPASALTAGWGDAAIVLRCGVPRPEGMSDPAQQGIEAEGVGWLLERLDGGTRFTTTFRATYVEVSMDERYAHDSTPLAQLADAVKSTVPTAVPVP
ncbi:DUF3515 domain-containing protein [Streptomyces sp. NPDC058953]|uniref:DUF3515 domain-containing protein n=1 Tax=unclassified Streptomyces TaxID=2593676 RepID=UPI0036C0C664